jgi:hypothetical protein
MGHPQLTIGTRVYVHDHPPPGKATWPAVYGLIGTISEDRGVTIEPWPLSACNPYATGMVRLYVVQFDDSSIGIAAWVFCDEEIEPLD